MRRHLFFHGQKERAFTLVEMLVSMAVLVLLVVLFFQIMKMASDTLSIGKAQADNFVQARVALDVMARDLVCSVLRPDLPAFFVAATAPSAPVVPELAFFTKQQASKGDGTFGTRPLSLVSYKLATDGNHYAVLRRTARGFDFAERISYSPSAWRLEIPALAQYADIGSGVLAMKYQFIRSDGTNVLPADVFAGWEGASGKPGVKDLRAVIFSLVVIDGEGFKILGPDALEQLKSNFSSNDPGPIRSFRSIWQQQLDAPNSLSIGGIPARVLRGIRTFERTVMLPQEGDK